MQRGPAHDKGHGAPMKRRAAWLQRLRPFGIGARSSGRPLAWPDFGCGCSSGVEHDLAKVGVEGSNPFARSKILLSAAEITKNYSIPRSESASERRFVLVDFTHMNTAGRLCVYEVGNMCTVRRAVGPCRCQVRARRTRKLLGVICYDGPVNLCRSSHRV